MRKVAAAMKVSFDLPKIGNLLSEIYDISLKEEWQTSPDHANQLYRLRTRIGKDLVRVLNVFAEYDQLRVDIGRHFLNRKIKNEDKRWSAAAVDLAKQFGRLAESAKRPFPGQRRPTSKVPFLVNSVGAYTDGDLIVRANLEDSIQDIFNHWQFRKKMRRKRR